ncbi:MAG: SagB/ThcOx family dehydrogenase [Candidatus Omnitrophica bacterium]|nr:SagB/ThcOx family dehydrogenase [Candidatus Omnitrophota bacterium]
MTLKTFSGIFLISAAFFVCSLPGFAQENKTVRLPAPEISGGKLLMQALKERKTSRGFSPKELSPQDISNMLWSANGINRPDSGHRTAPSAMNLQEIDIYVAKQDGLYLFDAGANKLILVLAEDIRPLTGKQPFVNNAPVNLIYVADFDKMGKLKEEDKVFYSAADTGFISENVYLFCASSGLATVVRGLIDKPALAKAMKLRPGQSIVLAQTVGFPNE